MEEAVYYKETEEAVYVKATGHVTALVCPPLKERLFTRLDREPIVNSVRIDLSECEYMDSTFLGFIVGSQKRLALRSPGAKVRLHRVNDSCKGLLRTIGIIGIVSLDEESLDLPPDMERVSDGAKAASARFLLEAHEELSNLSTENRRRFSTLTTVLKSVLESESGATDL